MRYSVTHFRPKMDLEEGLCAKENERDSRYIRRPESYPIGLLRTA